MYSLKFVCLCVFIGLNMSQYCKYYDYNPSWFNGFYMQNYLENKIYTSLCITLDGYININLYNIPYNHSLIALYNNGTNKPLNDKKAHYIFMDGAISLKSNGFIVDADNVYNIRADLISTQSLVKTTFQYDKETMINNNIEQNINYVFSDIYLDSNNNSYYNVNITQPLSYEYINSNELFFRGKWYCFAISNNNIPSNFDDINNNYGCIYPVFTYCYVFIYLFKYMV